jgi:hypothetical protein
MKKKLSENEMEMLIDRSIDKIPLEITKIKCVMFVLKIIKKHKVKKDYFVKVIFLIYIVFTFYYFFFK